MNNVHRSEYVECMIAVALGKRWQLTWQQGWDWAAWDLESESGVRLEVKQAAARQSWHRGSQAPKRSPRFDIAPRKGYWTREDSLWVDRPGRAAEIYLFAWHREIQVDLCDQSNAEQWLFYVVPERRLPVDQKSIGLKALEQLVAPCRVKELQNVVADAARNLSRDSANGA